VSVPSERNQWGHRHGLAAAREQLDLKLIVSMERLSCRDDPVDAEKRTLRAICERLEMITRSPEFVQRPECVHGTAEQQGPFRLNTAFSAMPRDGYCPDWLRR
jgi:hypothetical protein